MHACGVCVRVYVVYVHVDYICMGACAYVSVYLCVCMRVLGVYIYTCVYVGMECGHGYVCVYMCV